MKTYLSKLRRNILFQMGNLMEGTSIWVGLIISDYAIIYDVPPCKESLLLKVIKESLLAG